MRVASPDLVTRRNPIVPTGGRRSPLRARRFIAALAATPACMQSQDPTGCRLCGLDRRARASILQAGKRNRERCLHALDATTPPTHARHRKVGLSSWHRSRLPNASAGLSLRPAPRLCGTTPSCPPPALRRAKRPTPSPGGVPTGAWAATGHTTGLVLQRLVVHLTTTTRTPASLHARLMVFVPPAHATSTHPISAGARQCAAARQPFRQILTNSGLKPVVGRHGARLTLVLRACQIQHTGHPNLGQAHPSLWLDMPVFRP